MVLLLRDEEATKIDIPLFLQTPESKEGNILDITVDIDVQETKAANESVSNLLERLKNKNRD